MMHVNSGEHKRHFEDLLSEAEERRLPHDVDMPDYPDLGLLQPMASGLWGWLSQIISPQVASSSESLSCRTRYGDL